jgi:hypothetical protein
VHVPLVRVNPPLHTSDSASSSQSCALLWQCTYPDTPSPCLLLLQLHIPTVILSDRAVLRRQMPQFHLAVTRQLLYPAVKAELAVKCLPPHLFPLDLHSLTVVGDGTVMRLPIPQFRLATHWFLYPAIGVELAVKCLPLHLFRLPITYPAVKAELAVKCLPLHLFRLPIVQVLSLTPPCHPGHWYKGGLVHDFHRFRRIPQGLLHESLLMVWKHVRHLPFI